MEFFLALRQLLRPFGYLAIRHKSKFYFDWTIPIILSAVSVVYLFLGGRQFFFIGSDGGLSSMVSFFKILPGFFIASLAAVATFNKADIDSHMPAPAPEFRILVNSRKVNVKLTRRRFLCMLFSFLTAHTLSFILFGFWVLSVEWSERPLAVVLLICAVVLTIFWQIIVATMLGLYYLGERMHQA